jgi:hypothetical protein
MFSALEFMLCSPQNLLNFLLLVCFQAIGMEKLYHNVCWDLTDKETTGGLIAHNLFKNVMESSHIQK